MRHSLDGPITSHWEAPTRKQFRINQEVPGTVSVVREYTAIFIGCNVTGTV